MTVIVQLCICTLHRLNWHVWVLIALCVGESKAPPMSYNTARHVITVIVVAFLTQEYKAGKMQSTINQLKHGKGGAVRDNGTRGVVSIDQLSTRLRLLLLLSRPHL